MTLPTPLNADIICECFPAVGHPVGRFVVQYGEAPPIYPFGVEAVVGDADFALQARVRLIILSSEVAVLERAGGHQLGSLVGYIIGDNIGERKIFRSFPI